MVYQETDGVLKLENLESPFKKKAIYKDVGGVQKNQGEALEMLRLIPDLPHLGLKEAREESVIEICKHTVKWGGSPREPEISAQGAASWSTAGRRQSEEFQLHCPPCFRSSALGHSPCAPCCST